VAVVPEACGSRRVQDKVLAMDRMSQQKIVMLGSEMLVFEWLKTSEHPQFKYVLQLIKNR
jgi:hypothetical protein